MHQLNKEIDTLVCLTSGAPSGPFVILYYPQPSSRGRHLASVLEERAPRLSAAGLS